MTTTLPKLYTIEEAAAYLQLKPDTVRRHVYAGKLGSVKAGGAVRILESDIAKFLGIDVPDK